MSSPLGGPLTAPRRTSVVARERNPNRHEEYEGDPRSAQRAIGRCCRTDGRRGSPVEKTSRCRWR
jgi:hypothetical protein